MHEHRRALASIPQTDMPQTEQDHFLYPEQGNLFIYYPVSQ